MTDQLNNCLPCDGIQVITPRPVYNRPGLDALKYRIGTHSSFFESLLARISTLTAEELAELSLSVNQRVQQRRNRKAKSPSKTEHPLRDWLTTREKNDPAIAMLDAWSVVADVLTFYQERIANEGFLRTAQERRSIQELARLTGYRLRPGVSSTVYLAFEVEDTSTTIPFGNAAPTTQSSTPILIPKGTAVKSTPAPGTKEEPETFETSREFIARTEWNAINLRMRHPVKITAGTVFELEKLYFAKTGLRLQVNDYLAVIFDPNQDAVIHRIETVDEDVAHQVTSVTLKVDELSAKSLLRDVKKIIRSFPNKEMEIHVDPSLPATEPPDMAIIAKALQTSYDSFGATEPSSSLLRIDTEVHRLICTRLANGGQDLRKLSADFKQRTGDVSQQIKSLLEISKLDTVYRDAITSRIDVLEEQDTRLKILATITEKQTALATIGNDLFNFAFPPANAASVSPILSVATTPDVIQRSVRPFGKLAVAQSTNPSSGFSAKIELTRGQPATFQQLITPFEVNPTTNSSSWTVQSTTSSCTLNELVTAIQALTMTDDSDRDFSIQILDGMNSHSLIVQRTTDTTAGNTLPPVYFEPAIGLAVAPNTQIQLPQKLKVDGTPPADAKFCARVQLVQLHGASAGVIEGTDVSTSFQWETGSASGEFIFKRANANNTVRFTDFTDALNRSTFYSNPGQSGAVSGVIEIFRNQSAASLMPDDCLATSLVTFVFGDATLPLVKGIPSSLRVRVHPEVLVTRFNDVSKTNSPIGSLPIDYWPSGESENKRLYASGGLREGIATTNLIDSLTEVAGYSPAIPADTSAKWYQRLTELVEDFDGIANDIQAASSASLKSLRQAADDATKASGQVVQAASGDQYLLPFVNGINGKVGQLTTPDGTGGTRSTLIIAGEFDTCQQELRQAATGLEDRGIWFDGQVEEVAELLSKALRVPRISFARKALERLRRFERPFLPLPGDAQPPGVSAEEFTVVKEVREWLSKLASRFTDVISQLDSAQPNAHSATCLDSASCNALSCLDNALDEIINGEPEPKSSSGNLTSAKVKLPIEYKQAAESLIDSFNRLRQRISPPTDAASSISEATPNEVAEAIRRLTGVPQSVSTTTGNLVRDLIAVFDRTSDVTAQLSGLLNDKQQQVLYDVLRSVKVGEPTVFEPKVYAFRSRANLFGWNSSAVAGTLLEKLSSRVGCLSDKTSTEFSKATTALENHRTGLMSQLKSDVQSCLSDETKPEYKQAKALVDQLLGTTAAVAGIESDSKMFLDGSFQKIPADSLVLVEPLNSPPEPFVVVNSSIHPRTAYGLKNTATEVEVRKGWWPQTVTVPPDVESILSTTTIYCEAEKMELAEEPEEEVLDVTIDVVCDSVVGMLATGKTVILQGLPQIEGTFVEEPETEQLQIVDVDHDIEGEIWGDTFHTKLQFASTTSRRYRRDSVRIYANVVEATHGETQHEVLGSGDGAKEFQKFLLKRPEVSQIVAPNERGIQSTLVVKVNDVEWSEEESLREAAEQQEAFVSQTNDAQQMSVVFGDGVNGARLPTGLENVRAEYRTGLGRKGNVAGGQINQLLGAPLGVKKVNNPLAAKGGADPESRELAREHAPLAVTAMDRLVSVQDYEDFARTYAGIGKASASMIQGTVHVTIAGLDPEPLDADNPIFSNLTHAFGIFGDPSQSFELHPREASLLIIVAKIKIDRRYEWQHVQPKIRTALLELFHYDRRDLGQDVLLSDAIAVIQSIEGVSYVDVDKFDAVRQQDVSTLASRLGNIQRRPRVHVNLARFTSDASERAALGIDEVAETAPTSPAANPGDSANNKPADTPKLRPAELCYLTPDIPDTLILELIP